MWVLHQKPFGQLPSVPNNGFIISLCKNEDILDFQLELDVCQFLGQLANAKSNVGQLFFGQETRVGVLRVPNVFLRGFVYSNRLVDLICRSDASSAVSIE